MGNLSARTGLSWRRSCLSSGSPGAEGACDETHPTATRILPQHHPPTRYYQSWDEARISARGTAPPASPCEVGTSTPLCTRKEWAPEGRRACQGPWLMGSRAETCCTATGCTWPTLSLGWDAGDSRGGASITLAPKPPELAPPRNRSPGRLGMAASGQEARMG